jgi:hypothetical protein
MSLSIYDPIKGCNVLNPDKFIINAFHPDYVKTYMPEFLSSIRTDSIQKENGRNVSKYVDKFRETKPSHGTVFGITEKSLSIEPKKMMTRPAHVHRPSLAPTEFHIFNKAGMPKGVKK